MIPIKFQYAVIFIVQLFLTLRNTFAQDSTVLFDVKVQAVASTSQVPFWLRSNEYGSVPVQGSFVSGQWGIYKRFHPNNPRFLQISGGVQLITIAGKKNDVFFSDLFLSAKAGPVEIMIGQRKSFTGLGDSSLTAGSVAMSGNARPYPKIQISTPDFVSIIPGNDIISFKALYSDGLLGGAEVKYGNVNYVPQTYLHQKYLYLKFGGISRKLNFHAGFNHQAIWGGEQRIFSGGLNPGQAYKYVVLGKSWAGSRVGNHFGTIDLAVEWKASAWNFLFYRQTIYEDGSLSNLSNVADGLNGIRMQKRKSGEATFQVNTFLLELFYSKSQGGALFDFDNGILGNDNYFNHYVYNGGWSYRNRSLGTPLIGPVNLQRDNLSVSSNEFTMNNRIMALHLGLNASWRNTTFQFKGTFSKNFGTYYYPSTPALTQSNFFLTAERNISRKSRGRLNISLAADVGRLYPNNLALSLGWRKNGFLN